jgi:hypothetical protein
MPSIDESPHAYLIVASVEAGEHAQTTRNLLVRLIRALGTKGGFSIAVNRQHGYALLCGFELTEDADRLAAAVNAKPTGKYGGWKSQRTFKLDERAHKKISSFLKEAAARDA